MFAVLFLNTTCILLAVFILPILYPLLLSGVVQSAIAAITGSALYLVILEELVKRSLKMQFFDKYPEGIEVYNLDEMDEPFVWSRLKVLNYPDTKYIPHPAMVEAEKLLKGMPLESLKRKPVYITGSAGTGKSTAAVQVMNIIKARYRKSLLSRPKLILLNESIVGNRGIDIPKFSGAIVVIVDDYQFLKKDDQDRVRYLSLEFGRGDREGAFVCISREHPRHDIPVVEPLNIDCSVEETKEYLRFVINLITQEAKLNHVSLSNDVSTALAQKILVMCNPPLYLVFLLPEHHDSELSLEDIDKIPKGMEDLCERSWKKLNEPQKDLVRSIFMLKQIRIHTLRDVVSRLYKCLLGRNDFNDVRPSLEHSIWFSTREDLIVAPDSAYDVVEYDDFDNDVRELAELFMEDNHENQKAMCVQQISEYYVLLGNLGLFFESSDQMLAEKCHRKTAEIALKLNIMKTLSISMCNLGILLKQQERYDEAVQCYRKSIEAESEYTLPWYNMGVLLTQLEQNEKALDAFRKATELNPDFAPAWNNLGIVLVKLDRFDEAIDAFTRSVREDPSYASPWFMHGTILMHQKKYESALQAFSKAKEADPTLIEAWYNAGLCLFHLNRFIESREAFETTLRINPEYTPALYGLGMLLFETGKKREGCDIFKRVKETAYLFDGLPELVEEAIKECKEAGQKMD